MRAFGTPSVVNPFDRFGDHLRLALNAPAAYQLLTWLEAGPGAPLPERGKPPPHGRWVMCGYGRFGQELTADLRAAGLDVTVIDSPAPAGRGPGRHRRRRVGGERAGAGATWRTPSGWWPAPTTTRRTCPCWPTPAG